MKTRTTTGLAVIGLLALAACDDSPTDTSALDQSINFDVAMVSADATIEDVQALRDVHHGGFFHCSRSISRPGPASGRSGVAGSTDVSAATEPFAGAIG